MGNLLAKNPLRFKHERLNEHNDRYFAKVQARNSAQSSRRHWRRNKRFKKHDLGETASLTDPCTVVEREEEIIVKASPTVDTVIHAERKERKKRRRQAKASIEGWQVKRKGTALQLRLAKNHFLQLAASGSISPVTLDSGTASRSLESPMQKEDLNSEFESISSNGMVWVEVAQASKTTAIAMSRNEDQSKFPLLLAVGSEDGVVKVTELLDEQQICVPGNGESTATLSVDSASRKFGLSLELRRTGKIRSLDFSGDGKYLVIGGDDCMACLVRITWHPDTRALDKLREVRELERVDRVYAVQFSPDNEFIAMAGFDGKLAIASLNALLCDESPSLGEISRSGLILCLDWSPCGRFVAIGM
jgi:WD40 repeat protein